MSVQYFITHVEPVHLLHGTETRFFIREQNQETGVFRTHVVEKDIPHYFFTKKMMRRDANLWLEELVQDPGLEPLIEHSTLKIEQVQYGKEKVFLRAQGSKEQHQLMPPPFLCTDRGEDHDPLKLNSPTRLLRWFYPPFLRVHSPEVSAIPLPLEITNRDYASLESVLGDSFAGIDIETEGWETGDDRICMAVYFSNRSQVVFHDFPFEDKE